ncbi:MAG: glycosyltransferase family A protein [Candidatus Saccharibacteria bacterium]
MNPKPKSKLKRPFYSVVIPALNEEGYIADTIESLKKQSYSSKFEIIVVDNNSSDNTAKVAKLAGAKVFYENNAGVCWARNSGTLVAKGDIIISTDADTVYSKNWLANIDKIFAKYPNIVAVAGPCKFNDAPWWGNIFTGFLFGLVNFGFRTFNKTYYGSGTNIAFKKDTWEGYDTSLTQGGDELDLLRRLRKKGNIYFDIKNPTYTSSRRLTRGLFYNFFITFLIFYILEYNLSRIFKRPVLGMYPKFRKDSKPHKLFLIRVGVLCLVFFIIILGAYKAKYIVLASPIHFNFLPKYF